MKLKKCKDCCVAFFEADTEMVQLVSYDLLGFKPYFLNNPKLQLFNYCPICGHKVVIKDD